jgi:tetratricopeptide (TPR) repeat protein
MNATGIRCFGLIAAVAIWMTAICSAEAAKETRKSRDQHILEIQALLSEDKLADADEQLRQAIGSYPHDGGFENLLGILALREGNPETAEHSFKAAIQDSPRMTAAYLNLGRLDQERAAADPRRLQSALQLYQQVLSYEPLNKEARYQAAYLLMRQGRYRESEAYLERLGKMMKPTTTTLSVALADHAALGEAEAARRSASALTASADYSAADAEEAMPGLIAGKRFDLIVELLECLRKQNRLPNGMLNLLGLAYENVGNLTEARRAYEASFAASDHSTATLVKLAEVARSQHDYLAALGYLAHAKDLEPKNAELKYSFGLGCLDLGLLSEAQKSFKDAVDLDPENASDNYAMGVLTNVMRGAREAMPYLETYNRLRPSDPRGQLAIGTALFGAKDYQAASPWLTKAAAEPETAAHAHYLLGRIANLEGNTNVAVRELKQALTANPQFPEALAELGHAYLEQGDYEHAEVELQEALKFDSDQYEANYNLLIAYRRAKDERQVAQAKRFDQVRRLSEKKSDEDAQRYLRSIEIRPTDP